MVGNRSNLVSSNHWQNQTQWHFWTFSVENDPDIAMSALFSISASLRRRVTESCSSIFLFSHGQVRCVTISSRPQSSCPSRQQHQCQVDVDELRLREASMRVKCTGSARVDTFATSSSVGHCDTLCEDAVLSNRSTSHEVNYG